MDLQSERPTQGEGCAQTQVDRMALFRDTANAFGQQRAGRCVLHGEGSCGLFLEQCYARGSATNPIKCTRNIKEKKYIKIIKRTHETIASPR